MSESVLFDITEELLKNLGSEVLDEIISSWGFKAPLDELKETITSIKDVLLDAEERQADSLAVRGWLEKLTTVVYAADDLFDEVATVALRQQLIDRNKVSRKVQTFFSSSNQFAFAFRISQKIKTIRKQFDDIVKVGTQFEFVCRSHEGGSVLSNWRSDRSISFVEEEVVFGRDGDKKAILDMLLTSSSEEHGNEMLPVIPIVGIGGIGKTALARLIYDDPQVVDYFELRLWVCVSDVFDVEVITNKILISATNSKTSNYKREQLQVPLIYEAGNKKYLLILDDMWNGTREKWLELRTLLKCGRKGSRILITTRSIEVAEVTGTLPAYVLQGLPEEKSWDLFEMKAFKMGEAQQKPQLVNVGKEIVKKCANVPLAIRTLGSLLYGKDDDQWLSLKDISLPKISENQSDIMKILKLSYHHLLSPLRNCFAYCSLFPKDYEFDKEMLKELWMAEGFIIPAASEGGQTLDGVAEEYFLTLLQRAFFQDTTRNEWGAITKCKMHNLLHDLAQEVAGVKCKVAKLTERGFDDKILHLSFASRLTSLWEIPIDMFNLKLLRTVLVPELINDGSTFSKLVCRQLSRRFSCLRVLDLHELSLKSLPSSIGKLIHLRFLNLSGSHIEELPNSITDLHNLQTLNLKFCRELRTLPKNIRKLINLGSLDVSGCSQLKHMPSGLAGLTSLNRLPRFIVNYYEELRYKPKSTAKLSDLKDLNNLRGDLHISIYRGFENNTVEAMEANLTSKQGITELDINFELHSDPDDGCNHHELVLQGLKPHFNLRKLKIEGYYGKKLPLWARVNNFCMSLPNLVVIELFHCTFCEEVPIFSQLPFLKYLSIMTMDNVEYMEDGVFDISSSSSNSQGMRKFFPFLEELVLFNMYNLKGWFKGVEATISKNDSEYTLSEAGQLYDNNQLSMQFCNLSSLTIQMCPNLISLPPCPKVEFLRISYNNDRLSVLKMVTTVSTTTPSSSSGEAGLKLKELQMDNVEVQLMPLPKQCLHQLSSLYIFDDEKLVSTKSLEVFTTLSFSLQSLEIRNCKNLSSISEGLEHLTALKNLSLTNCEELELSPVIADGDEDGRNMMPWKALKTNLRSLELYELPKLYSLPSGLQHLKNLRSLHILAMYELRELPEWISCLSSLEKLFLSSCPKLASLPEAVRSLKSLKYLHIRGTPGLTEKCQRPDGSDCPKFQHVPLVIVEG